MGEFNSLFYSRIERLIESLRRYCSPYKGGLGLLMQHSLPAEICNSGNSNLDNSLACILINRIFEKYYYYLHPKHSLELVDIYTKLKASIEDNIAESVRYGRPLSRLNWLPDNKNEHDDHIGVIAFMASRGNSNPGLYEAACKLLQGSPYLWYNYDFPGSRVIPKTTDSEKESLSSQLSGIFQRKLPGFICRMLDFFSFIISGERPDSKYVVYVRAYLGRHISLRLILKVFLGKKPSSLECVWWLCHLIGLQFVDKFGVSGRDSILYTWLTIDTYLDFSIKESLRMRILAYFTNKALLRLWPLGLPGFNIRTDGHPIRELCNLVGERGKFF